MTNGEQIYTIGEVIWNRQVSAGETATLDSKNYINLVVHIESNGATTITLDAVSVNGTDFISIDEVIHVFTSAGSIDYELAKILTKRFALKYRYIRFKTSDAALIKIIVTAKFGILEVAIEVALELAAFVDAVWDELLSGHLGVGSSGAALQEARDFAEAIEDKLDDPETGLAHIKALIDLFNSYWTGERAAELSAIYVLADSYLDVPISSRLSSNYFEQLVPIAVNLTKTIGVVAADADFIASNTTGASGLISIDDTKVQKIMLIMTGVVENIYDGSNGLDCSTPTDNQLQINLDGGAYSDLVNEEADGQMLDYDWRCEVKGAASAFALMFNVTGQVSNIDGKVGLKQKNARAKQASLVVTANVYLRVLWRL